MISLPTELSLEQRRRFFVPYSNVIAFFGTEMVDKYLMLVPVKALVEVYASPQHTYNGKPLSGNCFHKEHEFLGTESRLVTSRRGDWSRQDSVPCNLYMIRNSYPDAAQRQVIGPCLREKFPFLRDYEMNVYQWGSGRDYEFYILLSREYHGHRSLYVPLAAIADYDVAAITQRNESYLKSYSPQTPVWEEMQHDPVWVRLQNDINKAKADKGL